MPRVLSFAFKWQIIELNGRLWKILYIGSRAEKNHETTGNKVECSINHKKQCIKMLSAEICDI